MPYKKGLARFRTYRATPKSDTRMFPSTGGKKQGICINEASTSTSNKSILLPEMERHNKVLDVRYPDIKNNNKCSTSINIRNENYIHDSIVLQTQSNLKDFDSIEINDSDCIEQQINIERENIVGRGKANSRNKVPESKLVALRSSARKAELISECHKKTNLDCTPKTFSRKKLLSSVKCDKSGTSSVEARDIDTLITSRDTRSDTRIAHNLCRKNNVHLINKKVPDKNKKAGQNFQQSKINDRIVSNDVSNNFSRLTHNIVKDQEAKQIKNGITALPAKPTRSLPLKTSVKDNNDGKKLRLGKVKNKLSNSTQSFTEKMQSTTDNDSKSTECIIRQQISSHKDTDIRKTLSEATNENNDLQNEEVHQNTSEMNVKNDEQNPLSNVKKKRGRPRKTIDNFTDQSTAKRLKNENTSQEISDTIAESMTRDKRRANKINITNISDDLSDESDVAEDKIFVKKRGRPRGRSGKRGRGRGRGTSQNSLDTEYIPRLTAKDTGATIANVANIENAATDSKTPNTERVVQLVTCARCDQEMPKKQWLSHNLNQHNNMAWQKDEEPLDFENDVKLLKRVLTSALKQKKKYLTCEKCEAIKRSVNGFVSHMQFCGKSAQERQALMVTCPICKAVMMPSSVEVHERYHRQLEENKNNEANVQMEKTKRKAAERAMPKILEFTESLKEKNLSTSNVIQTSSERKIIPSNWKVAWKKELAAKDVASCKQVGCTFTCSSYKSICKHYSQCNFMPQESFMCKICKFSADSKDKIVRHITEAHSSNNDLEKCSDYEIEENENSSDESTSEHNVKQKFSSRHRSSKINSDSIKTGKMAIKLAFLEKETTQSPQSTEIYEPALRWTLEFELENYELALFKDDMPNCFTLLGNNDAAKYFPELTTSMAFKRVDINSSKDMKSLINDNWKRMNRFEGDVCEAVPTFFVGGPIWALAWLPIPTPMYSKNPTQYVAISTHPTMESKYSVGKKYVGPNVIQIWDVGPLNHEVNSGNRTPVLAYAIAHNSGTVWCLEWCPSGCYQDTELGNYKAGENKPRRMGLLAAACSDGCIDIYSLPFPDELEFEKTEHNSWPIYKTDPVMKLLVNILMYDADEQNWQCTKLSWTKEHGHSVIAAGFTNGYIGLWHLTTVSPFLLTVRNNTKFINKFQHFFAHHNAITMVALYPSEKNRFLASASVDKSYKFWDRHDTSGPQTCLKRGIVANGAWMRNWPCAVLSFDDALGYHYMHSLVVPVREFTYKYCPILATNSTTYGLAVCDHANGIAHGTLAGEVMTIFPHQLLNVDNKLLLKKRQLNSFIETVDLEEQQDSKASGSKDEKNSTEYHYMPETYNECKDRFGIIFHDNLTDLQKNLAKSKQKDDKLMYFPIEQYPFNSANRMDWNPNAWSYLWLMTGYQNGLVRLLNFSSMSTSRELDAQIPAHVKSMLAKREQAD